MQFGLDKGSVRQIEHTAKGIKSITCLMMAVNAAVSASLSMREAASGRVDTIFCSRA